MLNFLHGDPGGIRTPNRQSRNLIFYPVELRGQKNSRKCITFTILAFNQDKIFL